MSRARSAQVHVVLVRDPHGSTWAVGTPSQRGFTEQGSALAEERLRRLLPSGWKLETLEITPIDEVTAPFEPLLGA